MGLFFQGTGDEDVHHQQQPAENEDCMVLWGFVVDTVCWKWLEQTLRQYVVTTSILSYCTMLCNNVRTVLQTPQNNAIILHPSRMEAA